MSTVPKWAYELRDFDPLAFGPGLEKDRKTERQKDKAKKKPYGEDSLGRSPKLLRERRALQAGSAIVDRVMLHPPLGDGCGPAIAHSGCGPKLPQGVRRIITDL